MPSVYFLPAAEAELKNAHDWYDARTVDLGDQFFDAVDSLLPRISDNPRQFPIAYANFHRATVRRFPYALYFRIELEGVYVLACAHASRDPKRLPHR